MKYTLGIDIGGSTTKIVGFDNECNMITPFSVKADDPLTSTYGAFGKYISKNNILLNQIERIMLTGVGSSYIKESIFGLPFNTVHEFKCVGRGGIYLSSLNEAIVVSMGTGTSIVYANKDGRVEYLGGSGVGGGTLTGLSKMLLGISDLNYVEELAKNGNLENIDLKIKDLTSTENLPEMPIELTASNFGKISDKASKEDIALGILNMIYETIAMCSLFASKKFGITDIVLTGNLSASPYAENFFAEMSKYFNINYRIPKYSEYGPVIGAALSINGM